MKYLLLLVLLSACREQPNGWKKIPGFSPILEDGIRIGMTNGAKTYYDSVKFNRIEQPSDSSHPGIKIGSKFIITIGPDPKSDPCAYKKYRHEQDSMALLYEHIPIPLDTLGDPCHVVEPKKSKRYFDFSYQVTSEDYHSWNYGSINLAADQFPARTDLVKLIVKDKPDLKSHMQHFVIHPVFEFKDSADFQNFNR